jgi:hypothetical protein
MKNDPDWLTDFVITVDDLQRIETWLTKKKQGVTLEEITRRIIRGRLRYGQDRSLSALPEWVHEKNVLSWDELDKWCVNCQVLVADEIDDKIVPFFGVITQITENRFYIMINNKVEIYGRPKPRSKEALHYYEEIRKSIWDREHKLKNQSTPENIDEHVDVILLKKGAEIASILQSALESDKRYIFYNQHWYLRTWIKKIPRKILFLAYRQLRKTTKNTTTVRLREFISDLPEGEFGDISLFEALLKVPDLFLPTEDGWSLVTPPPPQWENAVGICYVYDPDTFKILLNPQEKLSKKVANRLLELDFYADVVEARQD